MYWPSMVCICVHSYRLDLRGVQCKWDGDMGTMQRGGVCLAEGLYRRFVLGTAQKVFFVLGYV